MVAGEQLVFLCIDRIDQNLDIIMELSAEQQFEMESFARLLDKTSPADLIDIATQLTVQTKQTERLNEHLAKERLSPLLTLEDDFQIRAFEIEAGKMEIQALKEKILSLRYDSYSLQRKYSEIFRKSWGGL